MTMEDNEDFDLIGRVASPTDDEDDEVDTSTNSAEEEELNEEEETVDESEPDEEAETEEEPTKPVKDNRVKALDAERARRKQAEKELKELKSKLNAEKAKEEDEKAFNEKKNQIRQKLLEKDVMDEEVADTILDALGEDLIKSQIANERRYKEEDFDKTLSEFMKDEMFTDAEVYKPKIKELMGKGLTMEEAYGAAISSGRLSQLKKDLEIELEQKLLNNNKKADATDIGHAEAKGEIKRGKYTKREQEIAKETGLTVEEVHKRYMRPGELFSIEDLENL